MADEKKPIALGGTAIKPPGWDRTGLEAFRYMLYNPDTGEVLTRTPLSWLKITVFYCIYYSCLAAFWIACLQIFFLTIPESQPRWTLGESIIGTNPGVGVRPKQSDKRIDSSIFAFDVSDTDNTPTDEEGEGDKNADMIQRLDNFMAQNSNTTGLSECSGTAYNGKCIFDVSSLGDCASSPYGYLPVNGNVEPCLFLKLNKIYGWEPKGVKLADLDSFEDMSPQLKEKIRNENSGERADQVYMDCRGRFDADREALTLTYFPDNQGLPLRYFPFAGGVYQSPLVAVKVSGATLGQLLHIECRAWFEGVTHISKDKEGLVQFEVHVRDTKEKAN